MARALITNDDGIDSPGLWALAAAARDAGLEVVVAAPHRDSSGVGTSVPSVQDDGRTEVHALERFPSLMRHPGGRWTAVLANTDVLVDGLGVLPQSIVPLVTGSCVSAGDREWVFLEDASLWPSFC